MYDEDLADELNDLNERIEILEMELETLKRTLIVNNISNRKKLKELL